MSIGSKILYSTKIYPDNATNKHINWNVQNLTGSASVDNTGLVTFESSGKVKLTASSTDGSGIECSIEISIGSMEIVGDDSICAGNSMQLIALPHEHTEIENLKWSLVYPVPIGCSIDSNGLLSTSTNTPVDSEIKISATSDNCGSATKTIKVKYTIPTECVIVNPITTVQINTKTQYYAYLKPQSSSKQDINWIIDPGSTESTISYDGILSAGANPGVVKIEAYSQSYPSVKKEINITITAIGISGNDYCPINSSTTLKVTKEPTTEIIPAIFTCDDTLTSTGTTISEDGIISAGSKPGIVKITATATDGSGWTGIKYLSISQKFSEISWSDLNFLCKIIENNWASNTSLVSKCLLKDDNTPYLKWIDLVGSIRTINVNGKDHSIRIIGTGLDNTNNLIYKVNVFTDEDGIDKNCALTFEFSTLLSDSDGYSLATFWDDNETLSKSNSDYLNSTLRKNLVGEGNSSISWYEKSSSAKSTKYKKTVLDMISEPDLIDSMKKPKTNIMIGGSGSSGWKYSTVEDKIFILNWENYFTGAKVHLDLDRVYTYYSNAYDSRRIKHDLISDTTLTPTKISDCKYLPNMSKNYAGTHGRFWNSQLSINTAGSDYWTLTPSVIGLSTSSMEGKIILCTYDGGGLLDSSGGSALYANFNARPIAPAFCI